MLNVISVFCGFVSFVKCNIEHLWIPLATLVATIVNTIVVLNVNSLIRDSNSKESFKSFLVSFVDTIRHNLENFPFDIDVGRLKLKKFSKISCNCCRGGGDNWIENDRGNFIKIGDIGKYRRQYFTEELRKNIEVYLDPTSAFIKNGYASKETTKTFMDIESKYMELYSIVFSNHIFAKAINGLGELTNNEKDKLLNNAYYDEFGTILYPENRSPYCCYLKLNDTDRADKIDRLYDDIVGACSLLKNSFSKSK